MTTEDYTYMKFSLSAHSHSPDKYVQNGNPLFTLASMVFLS